MVARCGVLKVQTQLFFDEIIKEIHPMLKPLNFKKKSLNFYRLYHGFHQLINIQKSAYVTADNIGFAIKKFKISIKKNINNKNDVDCLGAKTF